METYRRDLCERITGALRGLVTNAEPRDGNRWTVEMKNGRRLQGIASIEDDWFRIDMPLAAKVDEKLVDRLAFVNGRLSRGKLVLRPRTSDVSARVEVLLDEEADVERRVGEVMTGIKEAVAGFAHEKGHKSGRLSDGAAESTSRDRLMELCAAGGWDFSDRGEGRIGVGLKAREGYYQSILDMVGGRVELRATLGRFDGDPVQRTALGLLALRASGLVKIVRFGLSEVESSLEVSLGGTTGEQPTAAEFDALVSCALVGCTEAGREVARLGDPGVARAYLEGAGSGFEREQ